MNIVTLHAHQILPKWIKSQGFVPYEVDYHCVRHTNKVTMFDEYNHNNAPVAAPPSKVLRYDSSYIKSMSGVLKVVQILCNLVGFICIMISWSWLASVFYNLLYWVATLTTALLLLLYSCHCVEKYDRWPWHRLEFFYCVGVCLAYVVTSVWALALGKDVGYAVAFFGLCAIISYGMDGYLKFRSWKRGLPPQ